MAPPPYINNTLSVYGMNIGSLRKWNLVPLFSFFSKNCRTFAPCVLFKVGSINYVEAIFDF